MKKIVLAAIILIGFNKISIAQPAEPVDVNKVIEAEKSFNKLVERKGIKGGFLAVADPEGIVFKPDAVNIAEFYNNIDKQSGSLSWTPNFARISGNGDLAFTAGPYVYQNGKGDDDKVYGDYFSLWRIDAEGKFRLLINLGIQHPEPDKDNLTDFRSPEGDKRVAPSKDPFNGKKIILATDELFNHSLTISTLGTYKEFLSLEGHFYFPGFEPLTGRERVMKFLSNEAITISAKTVNAGRSTSNDLAYTYGKARIKKGSILSNYNYVRIWELDKNHKWNILLEAFSAIENE
jgi:hypothetical protein